MIGAALHTAAGGGGGGGGEARSNNSPKVTESEAPDSWPPGSFQKLFSLVSQLKHGPTCGETLISESKAATHLPPSLLGGSSVKNS